MNRDTTSVLIADKVPHVRSALRLLLCQASDFAVVGEAADTAHAAALALEQCPDLVLLEWELPGQNGSSAVTKLEAAQPGLTVIAVSARPEARGAALAAGADAFVSKLDPPERLLATMRDCVAKRHNSSETRREAEQ